MYILYCTLLSFFSFRFIKDIIKTFLFSIPANSNVLQSSLSNKLFGVISNLKWLSKVRIFELEFVANQNQISGGENFRKTKINLKLLCGSLLKSLLKQEDSKKIFRREIKQIIFKTLIPSIYSFLNLLKHHQLETSNNEQKKIIQFKFFLVIKK